MHDAQSGSSLACLHIRWIFSERGTIGKPGVVKHAGASIIIETDVSSRF